MATKWTNARAALLEVASAAKGGNKEAVTAAANRAVDAAGMMCWSNSRSTSVGRVVVASVRRSILEEANKKKPNYSKIMGAAESLSDMVLREAGMGYKRRAQSKQKIHDRSLAQLILDALDTVAKRGAR